MLKKRILVDFKLVLKHIAALTFYPGMKCGLTLPNRVFKAAVISWHEELLQDVNGVRMLSLLVPAIYIQTIRSQNPHAQSLNNLCNQFSSYFSSLPHKMYFIYFIK